MWTRTKHKEDMGWGFRYMTGIDTYVRNNILGCTFFGGIDHTRIDSEPSKEAARKSVAENNIFFLNKQGDLCLPGGGKWMFVNAEDFADVEQLDRASGNRTLSDPSLFKGVINEPYLNGFLTASYSETGSVDPNSPANTFRQAMGMNMTAIVHSTTTMHANRYPWREALKFFGAMEGYGAQEIMPLKAQ
jgi:hypothetical protein